MVTQNVNELFAAAAEPKLTDVELDDLYGQLMQRIDGLSPALEPSNGKSAPATKPAAPPTSEETGVGASNGASAFKLFTTIAVVAACGAGYFAPKDKPVAVVTMLPEVNWPHTSSTLRAPAPPAKPAAQQSVDAPLARLEHRTVRTVGRRFVPKGKKSLRVDVEIGKRASVKPPPVSSSESSDASETLSPSESSQLRESDLIRGARVLLHTDPAAAADLLDKHARLFPNGALHGVRMKLRQKLRRIDSQEQRP